MSALIAYRKKVVAQVINVCGVSRWAAVRLTTMHVKKLHKKQSPTKTRPAVCDGAVRIQVVSVVPSFVIADLAK